MKQESIRTPVELDLVELERLQKETAQVRDQLILVGMRWTRLNKSIRKFRGQHYRAYKWRMEAADRAMYFGREFFTWWAEQQLNRLYDILADVKRDIVKIEEDKLKNDAQ